LCVVVCDLETSWMMRPWPTGGCRAKRKYTRWGWESCFTSHPLSHRYRCASIISHVEKIKSLTFVRSVQPAACPLRWLSCASSSTEASDAEYFTCRLQFLCPLSKPLLFYPFTYLILPSKLMPGAQNVPTPLPPLRSTPDQQATCLERVATRAMFTWLLSNTILLP